VPLDPDVSGARQWLDRAESSLALAKQPKPENAYWDDLCYLAQQAAEKALKAVYHSLQKPHRFTHDIEELGKGLADLGLDLPNAIREAVVLTRYAVETRYPGVSESTTDAEYRDAVKLAEEVVQWARGHVRTE
jgi:HEPN domain-containing protein